MDNPKSSQGNQNQDLQASSHSEITNSHPERSEGSQDINKPHKIQFKKLYL